MSNENQDLLDLCRLNQMEDNLEDSVSPDTDETMKAIDYRKRQIVTRMKHNPPEIAPDAMEKHIEANTMDGVYPWTDAEEEIFEEDEL